MKVLSINMLLSLVFVVCLSCTKEYAFEPTIQPNEILVHLTINTPLSTNFVTKNQNSNEYAISNIQVLVFEDNAYKYKVKGNIVSSSSGSTVFNASLKSSPAKVKLWIIANAEDALNSGFIPGSDELTVKEAMVQQFTSAGINRDFPMFGECTLVSGLSSATNTITNIKMLRAIARVDVTLGDGVDNFELKTIQAFRANNRIQVIPNNLLDTASPVVGSPSIPSGATATIKTSALTVSNNVSVAQLYIPESVAPPTGKQTSDATCIIIGGFYNGSTDTTYYRIDFDSKMEGHPFGQILRNHRYIFSISSVTCSGLITPEEAAEKSSTGINVIVENWDDNITDIQFSNNTYFGISSRKVTVESTQNSTAILHIETNIGNYKIQWLDENGNLTGTAGTEITSDLFKASISGDETQVVITALTNNVGEADKTQKLQISAGTFKITVAITQLNSISSVGDHSNTYIHVLSMSHQIGNLGAITGGGNADGVLPLLTNTDYFGPNGVVKMGGFGFSRQVKSDFTALTETECRIVLERFDVLNITIGSDPDEKMSKAIISWLAAKNNRVLFVTRESANSNTNLISLLCGTNVWSTTSSNTAVSAFVGYNEQNDYFTKSGPFGAVNPIAGSFWHNTNIGDWAWMGIIPGTVDNIVPLLQHSEGKQYVLAIDTVSRIVYLGDSCFYTVDGGLSGTGGIDSDLDRLVCNIYAWVINEIVLPGKPL